jgi:hypothetical protein
MSDETPAQKEEAGLRLRLLQQSAYTYAAVQFLIDIDYLRKNEGDSIEIICDNPEAESRDKLTAVDVTGDWTDYSPRRFYGPDPAGATRDAATARKNWEFAQTMKILKPK